MKKYLKPSIRINQVHSCDVIITSDPQLNSTEADNTKDVLAPGRGSDWENW